MASSLPQETLKGDTVFELKYSIGQFLMRTSIYEAVFALTIAAAIFTAGCKMVSLSKGGASDSQRAYKSCFVFCCVLVVVEFAFFTAKRYFYPEIWNHEGPLYYGLDLLHAYCCVLIACTVFAASNHSTLTGLATVVALPTLVALSALNSPYVTLDRALSITAVCLSILVFAKKLQRPQARVPQCVCACMAILLLVGAVTQELIVSDYTLLLELREKGFQKYQITNTCYYELSREKRGITRVALPYQDLTYDITEELQDNHEGDSIVFYDISCIRSLDRKAADVSESGWGSMERFRIATLP